MSSSTGRMVQSVQQQQVLAETGATFNIETERDWLHLPSFT